MTQDQMMTEWQNDAIKRRMGYTSEPMNPQLAAFGKAYGRDEGQFSAALNRAAQNTAPNPWDKAVKPANWNDEVDGPWDVAEATAAKRIRMGLIPSDSMPNVKMSTGPTQIGPFSLDIPNRTDMAQQYDAQANRTGIRDSRQRKIWEERDAAVRNLGQLGETLSTVINPFSRKNK
jgi:YD repeat-containing protein